MDNNFITKGINKVAEEKLIENKGIHFGQIIYDGMKSRKCSKANTFGFQSLKGSFKKTCVVPKMNAQWK